MHVHSKLIDQLRLNLNSLYDLHDDDVKFEWNTEQETLFQQFKISVTKDVTLTFSNKNQPFVMVVASSSSGIGYVLTQMKNEVKTGFYFIQISYFYH